MNISVPSSRPDYDHRELEAVQSVLESNYTAEGPRTQNLEERLSDLLSREHVVATNSGSSALRIVLEASGIGPGDEVILPSYTCQAVLNPVLHTGAKPILADVDPDTYCASHETVQSLISPDTALIILVHNFGYPAGDRDLYNLDVPVLDDIAQAVGRRQNSPKGFASIGSLYATKQIPAGYGGFIASDDERFVDEIRDLKQYDGRDTFRETFNVSLSDVLSAIALEQIDKFIQHQDHKREAAERYDRHFSEVNDIHSQDRPPNHALYRYIIEGPHDKMEAYEKHMKERGIEVKRPVYKALSLHKDKWNCPESEKLHERLRLIPLLPDITENEIKHVLSSSRDFFGIND
ncbi:MAG: DegT/DnrJ/EryC1/StrS family aminotransferase [bacterium]